ncbi:hypothetical protein HPC49_09765 [Pyxidicoccus fallax]|uniref:Peptidase C-terminal archaeal/bacterial domain-containing protein n=2 Tax=Pyxidicoccus fallax TaxID=394095 RepID=A0A848L4E1_9BACT|nr:hypothetical protein [Pyxidicoccus fallax]NPC78530.1 hypothetical protein [Pyxidicoccus fallax]
MPLAACGVEDADSAVATTSAQAALIEDLCQPLDNGVTVTGLSATRLGRQYFCLDVPAGHASSYVMSGGTGDADLYVSVGAAPTTTSYNCRPYRSGNNETCNIAPQSSDQRIYIMLHGFSAYSNTTLTASY